MLYHFKRSRWHEGVHKPLITKELFDKVQNALMRNGRPNKYKKHVFPLLGLATYASCGCSITAERQKGHHYYRCTKKRGKCTEPYIREEKLADQIGAAIAQVALPTDIYTKMMAQLQKETATARQPIARIESEIKGQTESIALKLNKLLDAHLDDLIEKLEYQSKKESLLKQKIELEEKVKSLKVGATGWLEPCRTFLQSAHQAHQMSVNGDLESRKVFLKSIGSNFRLAARTLHWDCGLPWRRIKATARPINWRTRSLPIRTLVEFLSFLT